MCDSKDLDERIDKMIAHYQSLLPNMSKSTSTRWVEDFIHRLESLRCTRVHQDRT